MAPAACRRSWCLAPCAAALMALLPVLLSAQRASAPCGACMALLLDVVQARDTAATGLELSGRTILITPGAGGIGAAVVEAVRLRDRGATGGLVVSNLSADFPAHLVSRLDLVLVDLSGQGKIDERAAFAAKTRATSLRAVGIRTLALRLLSDQLEAGALLGLAPYFDVLILPGPSDLPAAGPWSALEQWTIAPDGISSDPMAVAALAGRARGARVLVEVPADRPDLTATYLRITGWRGEAGKTFATGVEVTGARTLSVEEIVARHQAAEFAARSAAHSRISIGRMVLTFEAPGFSAPFAITARTTIYSSPATTDVVQEDIRVNGLSLASRGDEVPRLPLIEPERVTTPPLVIALTDAYAYRLEGRETVRSRFCYVVAFEPRQAGALLVTGRAWIDGLTFGIVRIEAVQTGLPGPVVSSREVHEFEPVTQGSVTLWLAGRSEFQQTYETAIFSTPIHRVVTFERHLLDPPDYAVRHEAALRSDAVMMRDTPRGYRYLRRASGRKGEATAERQVMGARVQRVRTLAGGVTFDPNISVPMVFAGISYLDFNFLGKGGQIDGFFGGTYGRLAWSSAPLRRSGWHLFADAFGMALSYNDRAFRGGFEQYRENVTQRPLHLAGGLVGPIFGGVRLRVSYEMDYTAYGRSDSTAASFVVPASTPVHGVRLALERQHGPWMVAWSWNRSWRQHWTPWGWAGDAEESRPAFDRYTLRVARSLVWTPRLVGRVEGAAMGGRHLDRFSRYSLGTFDQPLRGYPSASIRFDRGVVVRSALSWSAAPRLRLDAFADAAFVRDPGLSSRVKRCPGIGAGVEAPLPLGLLAGLEWGFGFSGINTDGSRGTQVVRASVYKAF